MVPASPTFEACAHLRSASQRQAPVALSLQGASSKSLSSNA